MYVNKIQALKMAIAAIEALPPSDENRQAVQRLENMMNETNTEKWTKELVFERLNEWKANHGRNPTVTNLAEPGMPKATTVQRLFDMKASAFLHIYFPSEVKRKANTSPYTILTTEEWIEKFRREYERIKPMSGAEYNTKRDQNSPTWLTIARYCGVTQWNELLKVTEVDTSHLNKRNAQHEYIVRPHIALLDKLERLLEEREEAYKML